MSPTRQQYRKTSTARLGLLLPIRQPFTEQCGGEGGDIRIRRRATDEVSMASKVLPAGTPTRVREAQAVLSASQQSAGARKALLRAAPPRVASKLGPSDPAAKLQGRGRGVRGKEETSEEMGHGMRGDPSRIVVPRSVATIECPSST